MKLALLLAAILPAVALASSPTKGDLAVEKRAVTGVTGSAYGFATGTTGGGNVAGAYPSSRAQLVQWLEDSVPRVILINSEQDFRTTEGAPITTWGCRPTSNKCGTSGQDAINQADWCCNGNAGCRSSECAAMTDSKLNALPKCSITVKYDPAGLKPIAVGSNKSLVGVGANAALRGRGLRISGSTNVIIQNVKIYDLNPSLIWGGDAITLVGTDRIWIDHVTLTSVGRQMLVTGYEAARRVLISNSLFDGTTTTSAQCNGKHYWSVLLLGKSDLVTIDSCHFKNLSGRGPKVGGVVLLHAVNNFFENVSGHSFDIGEAGPEVIVEGSYFSAVTTPLLENKGAMFTVPAGQESKCSLAFGRSCKPNVLVNSGTFSANDQGFLPDFKNKGYIAPAAEDASSVPAYVRAHAGVGKI